MTVESLLTNMSMNELNHWIAFHSIEQEEYNKEKLELEEKRKGGSSQPSSYKKDVSEMTPEEVKAMFGM